MRRQRMAAAVPNRGRSLMRAGTAMLLQEVHYVKITDDFMFSIRYCFLR